MKHYFRKNKYDGTNQQKEEQPEPRQVSLIKFVLVALFIINLIYAIINFVFKFHEHYVAIGIMEIVVSGISLFVTFYYQKSKNLKLVTNISIIILTIMLILFFALAGSGNYAFYWISIYPPIVYFLLGSKKANIAAGLFFTCVFLFMISPFVSWNSDIEKIDSIVNIAGASIGIIFFIRHFDISRTEAANAIEEKNKELEELIKIDYLTGLYNRIKLDAVLNSELKSAVAGTSTFSIIMADLDNFKKINDTFGHLVGDSVLRDTAHALKKYCPEYNVIGRWGGEEFLIICPQTNKAKARTLCETLLRAVSEHKYIIEEKITMSFGVTEYIKGDTTDSLLLRADRALYYAKENGKSCVETF